jgi:hypothetical protein
MCGAAGAAYDVMGDTFRIVVQSAAGVSLSLSDGVGTLASGASTVRVLDVYRDIIVDAVL